MKKKMIIDRIPRSFCEGPFWGNGKMGAVMYVRDGKLCISVNHVGLWELRETLPDEPKADFAAILQHKWEYLKGDPCFVEDTNIFDRGIGRTRLPALAVSLELPGRITSFYAQTDLETAVTSLRLIFDGDRFAEGRIWLDSNVNILYLELNGEAAKELSVKALGWDLESPRLRTLKNWGYEPCEQSEDGDFFVVRQRFGGDRRAILCGGCSRSEEGICLAVGIGVTGMPELFRENGAEASLEAAGLERAEKELAADYLERTETFLCAHVEDWKRYRSGFGIGVPNERLQEAFDQEMYKLYCNEREDSMPITLQGIWNPDNRMPAWFGDLHNDLNVQSCYWPAYKTGNVKLVRPYVDWYFAAIPRLEERAKKLFGLEDAVHLPTMMAPDGTGAASEWCYWNTILGPELFAAVDFTWFYEYSRETDTLREKIYPFIEKVIHLYQGIAFEKADGYLHIPFTQSPEVDRDGHMLMEDDATFTLSSLHYLCRKMASYAQTLGKEGEEWLAWERRLAPVVPNEKGLPLFPGIDVFGSHRHFCQLYPIYPLCEEAHNELAERSLDTAVNQGFLEYAAFSFPYMGIMAARCGRGNMCRTMLEIYCMVFRSRNSFTVNGDPYQNGVLRISDTNAGESADSFTLESGFFIPTALCEMFVHRSENDLWLMMGIPDEWKACSCFGLTVEGGHRISLEREAYHMKKAVICAACDEELLVRWKGEAVLAGLRRDGVRMEIPAGTDGCLIACQKGESWTLEFEASPACL
ncbi:MAG TPA: hypothetical protein H9761_17375 [Candidatus Eisenbergiella merdavium]|uniref:Glycosyl hydrolase family 95 catalytic domain-containing protein n=1 Tax=Candidatus Eisenbergiella merdavium TaxID=2838551 RepID=A0A9D2SSN7_9FIRM|nr:hypothetical protein [Candidatus Eisenbergiella merdavium]